MLHDGHFQGRRAEDRRADGAVSEHIVIRYPSIRSPRPGLIMSKDGWAVTGRDWARYL